MKKLFCLFLMTLVACGGGSGELKGKFDGIWDTNLTVISNDCTGIFDPTVSFSINTAFEVTQDITGGISVLNLETGFSAAGDITSENSFEFLVHGNDTICGEIASETISFIFSNVDNGSAIVNVDLLTQCRGNTCNLNYTGYAQKR